MPESIRKYRKDRKMNISVEYKMAKQYIDLSKKDILQHEYINIIQWMLNK